MTLRPDKECFGEPLDKRIRRLPIGDQTGRQAISGRSLQDRRWGQGRYVKFQMAEVAVPRRIVVEGKGRVAVVARGAKQSRARRRARAINSRCREEGWRCIKGLDALTTVCAS